MNHYTNLEALQPLHEFIQETYCGDYLAMERKMSEVIYLLHYLPWETFAGERVQNIAFVLDQLRLSFIEAQELQQRE